VLAWGGCGEGGEGGVLPGATKDDAKGRKDDGEGRKDDGEGRQW